MILEVARVRMPSSMLYALMGVHSSPWSVSLSFQYLTKLTITLGDFNVKGILKLINEFRNQPTCSKSVSTTARLDSLANSPIAGFNRFVTVKEGKRLSTNTFVYFPSTF